MRILDKGLESNKEIKTIDDWFQLTPPKEATHWKDGRSAKELARYMLTQTGKPPIEIANMLSKKYSIFTQRFDCYPEHVTKFDDCKGEGRNHDLLMVAEDQSILLGVEAKADEEFGRLVRDEWNNKELSENKRKRIRQLVKVIFGVDSNDFPNIRYQLLTATAGTLYEAKERGINKAILLIVTLKKENHYNENKVLKNNEDLNDYRKELNKIYHEPPYRLHGYPNIEFTIESLEINVTVKSS